MARVNGRSPRPDPELPPDVAARLRAAVDLLGRTGARGWEVAWEEDTDPVVWTATVTYRGTKVWRQALDPVTATEALVVDLVTDGQCTHCGKLTKLAEGRLPAFHLYCGIYRRGDRYLRSCATEAEQVPA